MSLSEDYASMEDLHPIDIVETLAEHHAWEFDRVTDDQIAMAVEGQWRTYSLTLAWSEQDETLRLICTFEMEPPGRQALTRCYDMLNRCNDMVWTGAFTWWAEQKLMVWRYGLVLCGGQTAGPEQIDRLISECRHGIRALLPGFPAGNLGGPDPGRSDESRHCRGLRPRLTFPGLQRGISMSTGSRGPGRAYAFGLRQDGLGAADRLARRRGCRRSRSG
jgi:hypothetical protein